MFAEWQFIVPLGVDGLLLFQYCKRKSEGAIRYIVENKSRMAEKKAVHS